MEKIIGISVIVLAVVFTIIFVIALCKASGTKDDVDNKALDYLDRSKQKN